MDTAVDDWCGHLDSMRGDAASARGFDGGGGEAGRPPRIVAYLSDFAVVEDAVPLRRQKALVDAWADEAGVGPIAFLIDSGRRDHPAVYGHAFHRLIAGARRHVDVVLVESVARFAGDHAMAMRAAGVLSGFGVRVWEVARWSSTSRRLAGGRGASGLAAVREPISKAFLAGPLPA